MTEERLKQLIDSMTLEEKVGQMFQVSGTFFEDGAVLTGPMQKMGLTEETVDLAGSVIGIQDAASMRRIQERYMERHPHKIPLLFMMDVINGYRTVFPIPLAQGASFMPELSERCARAAAAEASASGIHVTFAPMTDLVRDPRWGRVMESTGEDPWLNGQFSEAMVRGFQGDNAGNPGQVAACIKHFAAYGAPAGGRDYNTVELSEHTLREFYFSGYEKGIKAGAELVMTAFNTVNGIPATGNRWLMRDILRGEMGFDGVLISDWTAIEEMIPHGYCEDRKDAAAKALHAGVDIDMMSGVYPEYLCRLVREDGIGAREIDEAVWRILRLKNRLGLFENPYGDSDPEAEKKYFLCEKHRDLALEAAEKSFVLLKNEGILPIDTSVQTAFIGPYTDTRNLAGSWSFTGDCSAIRSVKDVLAEYIGSADKTVCCKGCPMVGPEEDLEGFTGTEQEAASGEQIEAMLEEAEKTAEAAGQVILFLGEHYLQSGEAASRADITIPGIQKRLFERVYAVNPNVAVVLFSGRPLDIREISGRAKAVLQVWLPGTEGAEAIMNVLTGKTPPQGKLPVSFPWCVGQVPVYYNSDATGRPYRRGEDQDRFRSKYIDIPNEPLYPFGFGLSYTSFEIYPVRLTRTSMRPGESIYASVKIKNTGHRAGTETVQMYIQDVAASVVRPVKELKGIRKVTLEPGAEENVFFEITEEQLKFHRADSQYESERGLFRVYIGSDSTTENKSEFVLR